MTVAEFIQEPANRALYTFDYGDDWRHDVLFEVTYPKEPGKKYPVCLAGELAGSMGAGPFRPSARQVLEPAAAFEDRAGRLEPAVRPP